MSRRLFFALWPGKTARHNLKALADKSFKKPVSVSDLHMTLSFLGNCNSQQLQCAEKIAQNISVEPFQLYLDTPGYFPKLKIQWVGTANVPETLLKLERALVTGLVECGFPERPKNKYVPHVTLARRLKTLIALEVRQPIIWNVEDFVLVETMPERLPSGGFYQVLKSWPLTKRVG